MNKKMVLCCLLAFILSFLVSFPLYAEDKNWEIRNYQTVRLDDRREIDSTYLTRIEASFYYKIPSDLDIKFELKPFGEAQYKWDQGAWSRNEAGVETGFHVTEYAYIGESFQYAWLDEYKKGTRFRNEDFLRNDTAELESRLEAHIPFVLNSKGYKITVVLIEEYTYSCEEERATLNEIGGRFVIPVFKYLDVALGWRHIDRIHEYDSDQLELTSIIKF
ncbi:MAG: hypothetical protein COS99_05365 [Candidatus Omnitrophica bacterium CG07_land_8_20_14_0_80_42_15]|uniref:DUF2490 domain-containing protein n=1 Tax=Candidatus Aquitaenariimonas noxiae TaxID=1974741 RepID=A0A2J0KVU9_9BACT|nr:MAG: hypothetical protein COS99_05365 [Candidatus Omnitrophica bacterium CG07_land_8_20_14_0_80_42_15]